MRQSSVCFRNYHHLAATHWFPEVEIHSIMKLTQPLYYVSRQSILIRSASKYRNVSIDIHNALLVRFGVPDFIYWMWSVFTIPCYCGKYRNVIKWSILLLCTGPVLRFLEDQTVTNQDPQADSPVENVASSVCKLNKSTRIWDLFHWIFFPQIKIDYNIIPHF